MVMAVMMVEGKGQRWRGKAHKANPQEELMTRNNLAQNARDVPVSDFDQYRRWFPLVACDLPHSAPEPSDHPPITPRTRAVNDADTAAELPTKPHQKIHVHAGHAAAYETYIADDAEALGVVTPNVVGHIASQHHIF